MGVLGAFSGGNWADAVADVSERPEFMTATVRIEDPSLAETEYDYENGTVTVKPGAPVYEGRARVIGMGRPGSGVEGQYNPTSITGVRVQVPRSGTTDIAVTKGMVLYVTSAPRQERLTEYVYTAVGDFQGSSSASRTFEFAVDQDSENDG